MKKYMKEYITEYRKNQSKNVFKRVKEDDELKSVEEDLVTNFIKDEVERSTDGDFDDANVDNDDDVVDNDEQDRITGFK